MCGGKCLQSSYKAVKLRSRDGDGRLGCSRSNWWNSRSHRGSSRSSLRHGTGGAKIGDAGASGIVSVGSSPCFVGIGVDYVYSARGGSRGATMGWVPRGAK